ncbi:MAG: DUF3185 family protein [SAR324 cluster bacterium]|nr:DUF3185 family protein [SAR324 cluster bacterium]
MNLPMNRIIGLVLIAAGAIVGWLGWEEKQSLGSKLTETFSGSPSDKAVWMLIIAGVLIVVGVVALIRSPRRR